MSTSNPTHRHSRFDEANGWLWFCVLVYAMSDVGYGYDTAMFGSVQALPTFLNSFGELDEHGHRTLSTGRTSILNSVVWAGKLAGVLTYEPLTERFGFKSTLYVICFFQAVGTVVEISAPNWAAFAVGRVIAYYTTGLITTCAPTYNADIAPAPLRSICSGAMTFFIALGQIWANAMSRGFVHVQSAAGWRIICAMQLIPAVIIAVLACFTSESPRWLIAHGRKVEALAVLNKIRPARDITNGNTRLEVEAMEQAVVLSEVRDMGRWKDIFQGTYLRRTLIAGVLGAFCQITGGQFINTYGPTFYKTMGLGDEAFTYALITTVLILVTQILALYSYDRFGRRPIMIIGATIQIPLMCVVAAVGGGKNPTRAGVHAVVACCIMFASFQRIATESPTYIICAEIGGVKLRKKIMTWGIVWNVLGAFATTFSVPYLLNAPYANLHAKVGWIFAGTSAASLIFIVLFVPELKARSLEEIDELFEKRLKAWQFAKAETSGIGAQIAVLQGATKHHAEKLEMEALHADKKSGISYVENAPRTVADG